MVDVYAYVDSCGTCAKGRVDGHRRTKPLRLFPPQDLLSAVCGPVGTVFRKYDGPPQHFGHGGPLLQVDPRGCHPTGRRGNGSIGFLRYLGCVLLAPRNPPDRQRTQLTSKIFQGVCRLMGIITMYSWTYHPQTQSQLERYTRTIVAKLKALLEDHQDSWDELVSVLTLACNSRPQQSTGVATLEFFVPERVRTFSLESSPRTRTRGLPQRRPTNQERISEPSCGTLSPRFEPRWPLHSGGTSGTTTGGSVRSTRHLR